MAELLEQDIALWFFQRGAAPVLAARFGVSRQTAWRDLQQLLHDPRTLTITDQGQVLYEIQFFPGRVVVSVTDGDGNELLGRQRRNILRQYGRYIR